MNTLQEKLQNAIDKKNSDISSFIWKGNKVLDENGKYVQTEKLLVDMTQKELVSCYEHCKTMLFNTDSQNPGRYLVLDMIADQKDRCGAELFLRHVDQNNGTTRFTLVGSVNEFLKNNAEALQGIKPTLDVVFSNMPEQYQKVPLNLLIDGCLDRLGVFNKKHITRTFILKQGIWLTPTESKELIESEHISGAIDRIAILREKLNIKEIEKLYLNAKGLSYTQMRAMLNIKPNKKYIDLTTVQLETLRNRILFNLEETVLNHIAAWERRMEEIELVAISKEFTL